MSWLHRLHLRHRSAISPTMPSSALALIALVCLFNHAFSVGISQTLMYALMAARVDVRPIVSEFWQAIDTAFLNCFSTNDASEIATLVPQIGFDRMMDLFVDAMQPHQSSPHFDALRRALDLWMRRVIVRAVSISSSISHSQSIDIGGAAATSVPTTPTPAASASLPMYESSRGYYPVPHLFCISLCLVLRTRIRPAMKTTFCTSHFQ